MSKKRIDEKKIKQLNSSDIVEVLTGIKEIRNHGNFLYIPELVRILRSNPVSEVQREIAELFNDLRDNKVISGIMKEIMLPENQSIQHILVASCWQSPLDYSNYFSDFVDIAIHSDYQSTIEAISVIENILMYFEIEALTISNQIFKVKGLIEEIDKARQPLLLALLNILQEKQG